MNFELNKKVNDYFLFFLVLIGFLIRIILLEKHPPIDVDEYSIAYNAFTISQEGKDEWGNFYPIFFKAFGDYKLPFDIYFVAFLYKIFSPNFFLLRFPSAFFGTLYIFLIYFFLKKIIKSKLIIFIGVILMTFSPTNIYFSRIISGSISQSFFVFLSIYFFTSFIKNEKNKFFLIVSVISLCISLYCYPSSWIIAPIIFIFYLFICLIKKRYFLLVLNLIVFLIFLLPIFFQFVHGGSQIRLSNVSKNFYTGNILEINEFRHHTNNDFLSKVFHNKLTYFSFNLAKNYLSHFDINSLVFGRDVIVASDSPFPILFFVCLPFYYLGFFSLIKKIKKIEFLLIFFWIIFSPFPSFITDSGFHSKRYLTFLGSEITLICLGLDFLRVQINKKFTFLFFLVLFTQIIYFLYYYFFPFRKVLYDNIYYKANILYQIIKNDFQNYDFFVYTTKNLGEPQIYPLFASLMSIDLYLKEKKYICNPWCFIKPFNKFYYSEDLNNIVEFITKNREKNRIMGFFSQEEIEDIKKYICFKTKQKFFSKGEDKSNFYLIEPKKCQQ